MSNNLQASLMFGTIAGAGVATKSDASVNVPKTGAWLRQMEHALMAEQPKPTGTSNEEIGASGSQENHTGYSDLRTLHRGDRNAKMQTLAPTRALHTVQLAPPREALRDAVTVESAAALAQPSQTSGAFSALARATLALPIANPSNSPVTSNLLFVDRSSAPDVSRSAAPAKSGIEAEAEVEPATKGQRSDLKTDAFTTRQLHVFLHSDWVQAWIRDTSLSQFHVYAVEQRLREQLQSSGFKLRGLTVNGKAVVRNQATSTSNTHVADGADTSNAGRSRRLVHFNTLIK